VSEIWEVHPFGNRSSQTNRQSPDSLAVGLLVHLLGFELGLQLQHPRSPLRPMHTSSYVIPSPQQNLLIDRARQPQRL